MRMLPSPVAIVANTHASSSRVGPVLATVQQPLAKGSLSGHALHQADYRDSDAAPATGSKITLDVGSYLMMILEALDGHWTRTGTSQYS